MPAKFEAFGVKFLYPDNWSVAQRTEEEGDDGVTLEMPSGGFLSIEQDYDGSLAEEIIEEVRESISAEYGELERESLSLPGAKPDETCVDFSFYCLDLLVVSRLILMTTESASLVIQIQAEIRDFETNEAVFAAILQQLRSC